MKRVLWGFCAVLILASLMFLPACGGSGGGGGGGDDGGGTTEAEVERTLIGTWVAVQASNPAEVNNVWVFKANGKGSYTTKVGGVSTTYPLTYTLTGNTLAITIQGVDLAYTLQWITDTRIKLSLTADNWSILDKVG